MAVRRRISHLEFLDELTIMFNNLLNVRKRSEMAARMYSMQSADRLVQFKVIV